MSRHFWMQFDVENAAFDAPDCGYECARILRQVADRLEAGLDEGTVADLNGNKVGSWTVDLPEEEPDQDDEEEGGEE